MKIGITCYPVVGGSGIIATELGQELAGRGHQVHFVSYALPFRLDKYRTNLYFHAVETTAYPLFKYPPYTLALSSRIADVARNYELDIVHVHYAVPHATCAYLASQMLAAQGSKLPKVITTLHGTDITLVGSDPSYFDITKFSINTSDGITAVSQHLADETAEVFGVQRHIRVVHNFFDQKRFGPNIGECSRCEFANEDEFLLAHVSNFRPVKRTLDVIEIFEKVANVLPAKLILIGEGPDTVLARRMIKRRNLTERVIFLGNQSRVEAVLPCADLFLLPSQEESFGLAALEALACGVPVIGTHGTGLVEVIDDGQDGFLLPIGDTTGMAEKAIELLKDRTRLSAFKSAAVDLSRKKFAQEKIVGEYEQYYEDVLNG
ncbi:N-acetyl-alpha-D-glucosaminyl L-malate synthase BshA [candidate division GN15 bacterium]|nr:N-acetyl-alpha-D-glucosaminyl L-malate synthase BshA [candidate division GN15 bacterium]